MTCLKVPKNNKPAISAMREALEMVRTYAQSKGRRVMNATWIYNVCNDALSAPVRNCDVGSPEEQSVRMAKFCRTQYEKSDGVMMCSACRFHNREGLDCQFAWAQMPYEEEEENDNESKS